MRALLLLSCVAVLSSCASDRGFGVEVTLRFDSTVSDEALRQVDLFAVTGSLDDSGEYDDPVSGTAKREERFFYHPNPASRHIGIDVVARAGNTVVATGSDPSIVLATDHSTSALIILSARPGPDGGVDMGTDGSVDSGMDEDGGVVASRCTSAGVQLCDPFENGAFDSAWTLHQTNGSLTVDTSRAYRGASSMHVHDDGVDAGTSADVRLSETQTLTPSQSDIFVRAFYYIPVIPTNAAQLFSTVTQTSPYQGVAVLESPSGNVFTSDSVSGGAVVTSNTVTFPKGRWFCLEWQVHVAADTTGSMNVWLDGTLVADLARSEPTSPSTGLQVISVGNQVYMPSLANPATDVWIDEVAIDTARITCEK